MNKHPTFLNLGASYPDNPLTIVIFCDDRKNFKQPSEEFYENKNVCVTGMLKDFTAASDSDKCARGNKNRIESSIRLSITVITGHIFLQEGLYTFLYTYRIKMNFESNPGQRVYF